MAATICPVVTTGYRITIFGDNHSPENSDDLFDFSSLSLADDYDLSAGEGREWTNSFLQKIEYNRYPALTDEQTLKYGLIWLYECLSGDLLNTYWFGEWTLILALQAKTQIGDGQFRSLFADFLFTETMMPTEQSSFSFAQTYITRDLNLRSLYGDDQAIFLRTICALIDESYDRGKFDFVTFFEHFFQLPSDRERATLISHLALCSFRTYCIGLQSPIFIFEFANWYHFDIPKAPHQHAFNAIRRTFTEGSVWLRSILIPSLAIWLRLQRPQRPQEQLQELQPSNQAERIIGLLGSTILLAFRFHGLYPFRCYANISRQFDIEFDRLLKMLFDDKDDHYAANELRTMQNFLQLYREPQRSAFPWARSLDPDFMRRYSAAANPWITSAFATLLNYYDLFRAEIDDFEIRPDAIYKAMQIKNSNFSFPNRGKP